QPLCPLAQGMLLVSLPEKTGVVETRPQHPFMAVADDALRIAIGVQDSEKVRQQFMLRIFDGKILLMVTHHRDQDFLRQLQELGIKIAQDDGRKLGEIDDCVQKSSVFAPTCPRYGPSSGIKLFPD